LFFSIGRAEIYKWVDEKGTIHFTHTYDSIPEKYRDQVETRPEKVETQENRSGEEIKKGPGKKPKRSSPEKQPVDRKTQKAIQKNLDKRKIESEVTDIFQTIVSLWKSGKYDEIYEYGTNASKTTIGKEDFVRRMGKKTYGLSSSWETITDMKLEVNSPTLAYVTTKIGFKPKQGGNTFFKTGTYQMVLENKTWRINLSKILLATD